LGDKTIFLKAGEEISVLNYKNEIIGIELPDFVVLRVEYTEPGMKGDTVTNVFKPARLENGLEIKVPLFINVGDRIKVDTRTNEYVERA
jgi:elongation factor P